VRKNPLYTAGGNVIYYGNEYEITAYNYRVILLPLLGIHFKKLKSVYN
jgi:hypothetical protein